MMVNERTPLLLRPNNNTNKSSSSTINRLRAEEFISLDGRLVGDSSAATSSFFSSDEDVLFLPVNDSTAISDDRYNREHRRRGKGEDEVDDKADRRGLSARMGSVAAQQFQKGMSLFQTSILGGTTQRDNNTDKLRSLYGPGVDEIDKQAGLNDDDDAEPTYLNAFCCNNNCVFGTHPGAGIWWNGQDQVGSVMALTVWILFGYSVFTVLLLAATDQNNNHVLVVSAATLYCTVAALALASHAKTALTDPGTVPLTAVPPVSQKQLLHRAATTHNTIQFHSICSLCQTYKPAMSHHCRICNRCVSRMDHHCPWMNNCVGAANYKHFILFLLYTWIASCTALTLFAANYFFCPNVIACQFPVLEGHLIRVMSALCLATLLFTTHMLLNVIYSIATGVGTIDRLKKKATGEWETVAEEPILLTDIFGTASVWTWWLPTDPVFDNQERVFRYSTVADNDGDHATAAFWQNDALKQGLTASMSQPTNDQLYSQDFIGARRRQWDGLAPLDI
jgi:palmitoyltransferase ZDHHC3/7/25